MKVTIAGAGIGGLTTALALAEAGHDVRVYEAVEDIQPLGVGINLLPHAARILQGLGVLDDLLARGIATRELAYFNRHGQQIWTEPRGLFAGFDAPQVSIARGDLQETLLAHACRRLDDARIVTGQRLTAFRTVDGQAIATFQSPAGAETDISSDILVCADGIHSAGRHQMYPDEGTPVYSGRILWRATSIAVPYMSGATMIMAGHEDQKFVCYPIEPVREDGLQRINWIAELRRPLLRNREDWNREGQTAEFLPAFESWDFGWLDVPGLLKSAERIYEYPMVDRDPVPSWTAGQVTLLGDAAHAMYPIGSNGASQAILDADALTRALGASTSAAEALQAYEAERLPPTSAIVRANRGNGPEQCMQLAEVRAPSGFRSVEDIFAPGELQAIADQYKQLTGMTRKP